MLGVLERQVLAPGVIDDLLHLVDTEAGSAYDGLVAQRDHARMEIDRLVAAIAAGVPAQTVAARIREKEAEVRRLDARLAAPRPPAPDLDALREALEQRRADWQQQLRADPEVARLVVRRLIGPMDLWVENESGETVPFEAEAKPEVLLEGLSPVHHGTSPTGFEPVFWP